MKKMWALVPLMAGIAATPAYAQQAGFSGRAEVRVGYDEVRSELQVREDAYTDDFGVGDLAYGVEIGGDAYITEGLLVGAYAGVDLSKVDGCDTDIFTDRGTACIDAGRNLSVGVRAGIPTGDGGLIYAKAGWSNAKFSGSFVDRFTTQDVLLFEDSDTVDGYHLGAGFELGLGRTVYLKGEYVHHRYNHAFANAIGDMDQVDPSRHQLMAGIGVRFGGAGAPPPPLPPVAPPPPPPAQAPATQTCPDGSVVLATQACPVPPPPPPPPPPMPGERG